MPGAFALRLISGSLSVGNLHEVPTVVPSDTPSWALWSAPFEPSPPVAEPAPVTAVEVDRDAMAAAAAFAPQTVSALSASSYTPPAKLRSGGIGTRELARIAKAAQADGAVVRITLETAYSAGLLAVDVDRVVPAEQYDTWTAQEPAGQFAELLQAWRSLGLIPSQARDEDNKTLPAVVGSLPATAACRPDTGCLPQRRRSREGRV